MTTELPKRVWTYEELADEAIRECKRADEATSEWKLWREEALKQQQEVATLRAQLAARDAELVAWKSEAE